MALGDPLQWIIIAIVIIVVVTGAVLYYLGKARGQVKAMKEAAQSQKPPSS